MTHNCLDLKGPILTSVGTTCTWIKTCRDKHTYTELKISLKLSHEQDTFLNDSLWMIKIKTTVVNTQTPIILWTFEHRKDTTLAWRRKHICEYLC